MEGNGIERHINNSIERADVKNTVSQAAKDAVTAIALKYNISPTNAGDADRAIDEMLLHYESTGDHEKMSDLQNMAMDAAIDVFHALGYNQPEIMQDFMNEMQKALGHLVKG